MPKNAVREKKSPISKPNPAQPVQPVSVQQKSKTEQAMEYLNKFYPGWDTYLKSKDN
jgi:hypothetical protein